MATEILSIGTDATPSNDFTIAEGSQLTIALKGNSTDGTLPNAQVDLQIKDDDGKYWTVETLNSRNNGVIINAVGVYRVLRKLGGKAVGVFSV